MGWQRSCKQAAGADYINTLAKTIEYCAILNSQHLQFLISPFKMSHENLTLEGLAGTVSELTAVLTNGLKAANFPQPSFAPDAPAQLPPSPDIQGPRLQLVEALMNMLHLAMGPSEYFLQLGFGVSG